MAFFKRNMVVQYTSGDISSMMTNGFDANGPGPIENGVILKPSKHPSELTKIDLYNGFWNRTNLPQINQAMAPITKPWLKEDVSFSDFFKFDNRIITFELVFFPNSFLKRLLAVPNKDGIQFRRSICTYNNVQYQNLIAEVFPKGFITLTVTGEPIGNENIAEYGYGFACPPKWNT
jgi:hypothetical protein